MPTKWNLFRSHIRENIPEKKPKSLVDAMTALENLVGDMSMFIPFNHASTLKEAYEKLHALNHDPKKTALWIKVIHEAANPILYPALHAIACEFGWAEGEKQHSWILEINMEKVETKNTFKEATCLMMSEVRKLIETGFTWQSLETACWLRPEIKDVNAGILPFYECRDIACQLDWLQNGKWVE